jgi:NAD(P)H-dependent flavin oxidoreductase YrpB (nitropropane dioxygenase family)
MAGGPGTPDLVVAAAGAGGLGFLAGGYQEPARLAAEIARVRGEGVPFGVNLFVPNPLPVDLSAFRDYAAVLQPEADEHGLVLDGSNPVEDDDGWPDKVDLLVSDPVPVVSFTFGVPPRPVVDRLRRVGTVVLQTVTSADEAVHATSSGADGLVVQASAAGGHSGTFTPRVVPPPTAAPELVARVRRATGLPLLAAGGVATAADVADLLGAGAAAVVVGTVLLRSDEAGTSAPYRAALADPDRGDTLVTCAFTGRPARSLPNRFTSRYSELAPVGYPAVHHLTSPLRRAATAAGRSDQVNLWAGTGYRAAAEGPAGEVLRRLADR